MGVLLFERSRTIPTESPTALNVKPGALATWNGSIFTVANQSSASAMNAVNVISGCTEGSSAALPSSLSNSSLGRFMLMLAHNSLNLPSFHEMKQPSDALL